MALIVLSIVIVSPGDQTGVLIEIPGPSGVRDVNMAYDFCRQQVKWVTIVDQNGPNEAQTRTIAESDGKNASKVETLTQDVSPAIAC